MPSNAIGPLTMNRSGSPNQRYLRARTRRVPVSHRTSNSQFVAFKPRTSRSKSEIRMLYKNGKDDSMQRASSSSQLPRPEEMSEEEMQRKALDTLRSMRIRLRSDDDAGTYGWDLGSWWNVKASEIELEEVVRAAESLQELESAVDEDDVEMADGLKMLGQTFGMNFVNEKNEITVLGYLFLALTIAGPLLIAWFAASMIASALAPLFNTDPSSLPI
eukprot:CAMPEP_0184691990 /NCGR_PEP_ID=MMETSP0313-20130426/652_1 /TAXON_ID=2792 /ORGANISM="Porphyridium aerugineum, Strain SAG 1380-2" /LENGTH=216 /DNA_ID=CAMNT_0027149781 /DNA_START=246 /DNA_END=896 /DNA_ORIENTATION=+